ncbi:MULTISPECIES: nitrous oxide-stimulated promoter family protein [unclassified Aeromonas]|uniref:nitrous oxide-stimulated promoter family protein n=2 Tax=Aeromonas TaxID=642 RepID=UPI000FAD45D6|nr:nitrous oxide-stimulated promoter family protein [Aeromonas sp. sif2433]MBV7598509.1 nitrous oxide-stimulated promoter family protein [Aeromonas sp. sia0103]
MAAMNSNQPGTRRSAGASQAPEHPRLRREQLTVSAMIRLYCHHHHQDSDCRHCQQLQEFAHQRLRRCRYGHGHKPTCAKCDIHCYAPAMRKQIQLIMKWSGPRMLWHHPWLALRHLLDSRRKAPRRPHGRPLPP